MKQFSAVDVKAVVEELQGLLEARIEKIYHNPPDEIRIRLRKREKFDLIIEAGKRIHLTEFPREAPRFPTSFAMLLRKHLEGGRIKSIEQHDFDRVVLIRIGREEEKVLITEFFKKGNVILCNSDLKIIMPLKPFFKPGEVYKFPKPQLHPLEVTREDFKGEKEIVKFLASNLSIGGQYAEEICLRARIDKNKPVSELSGNDIDGLLKAISSIFVAVSKGEFRPHVLIKDGQYFDVLPVELKIYEKLEKKYFDSFNDALDDFYSKKAVEEAELKEKEDKVLEKIRKRLKDQLEAKKRFEREMEVLKRTGDLIYENYTKIEEIIKSFRKAREKKSWDEIKKVVEENENLSKLVKSIDPSKNLLKITLNGFEIDLRLDKSVPQIADLYYERAKRVRQKYEGVLKAIERTRKEIEKSDAVRFAKSIRVSRRREWYERFRWFFTSEGFLVIGGRNAKMNQEIVSKYMEKGDLFFHTQVPGAPVTVLKKGIEAGEESKVEAAQFAATYSSLWREGKYSGEVYYVLPEQVKRSAKAGEYLPKGSFYIEGKRNYVSASVSCAIGVDLKNLMVHGGPLNAIEKHCDYLIELDVGGETPNELSIKIASKLISMAKEDEKHLVRAIVTPDEVMKFLPPGRSRVKEVAD
jgi:predicted ribosome quality control (RQC) complex YloA/Tae2 family protein